MSILLESLVSPWMQAWLLRSSISRVPIVNLSPVLGRLHSYLGIALNSAGESMLLPAARSASCHCWL